MPAPKRSSSSSTKSSTASGRKGAAKRTTKATAASTRKPASRAATTTKRGAAKTKQSDSVVEQLANGQVKPRDMILLTRERIQEALDDAAARGRVTRKDANELVAELVRRGRHQGDDLRGELDQLIERGRGQLQTATKRARRIEPVDRLVRGADKARRRVGVGPSFPILGYDELNAGQVRSRLGDLSKADLRKVLTYERGHANRKTVTAALEKAIG